MTWLARLASKAPVPVYPAIGSHAQHAVQDLALNPRIQWVRSPRHARVLLVAGGISPEFSAALRRVHDQLPGPSATVWLRSTPPAELVNEATVIDDARQFSDVANDVYRSLLQGEREGEPHLCPDEPPAPWEGLGDHGQGGEGMMGGKPYGRAMAMTADDLRDGLQLDPLSFSVGPFWPVLPPGFSAHVTLHGDVIAEIQVTSIPYPVALPAIFRQALEKPVPIAELELARACYHLRQLSHALWVNGLESASLTVLQRIHALQPGDSLAGLRTWLRRVGFFFSAGAEKGVLGRDQAEKIGGPAARAAGIAQDTRQDDPQYQRLGFQVIYGHGSNCRARWQQWLDEAEQALSLAARAREQAVCTSDCDRVETPRGVMGRGGSPSDATFVLQELLPGLEWSEAIATIASLDLAAVSDYAEEGV